MSLSDFIWTAAGILALIAAGWSCWPCPGRPNARGERVIGVLLVAVAALGFVGLLCLELGAFTPASVGLLCGALSATILLPRAWRRRATPPAVDATTTGHAHPGLLLAVAAVGVAMASPRSEWMFTGRDQGTYLNAGVGLARHGELPIPHEGLEELPEEVRPGSCRGWRGAPYPPGWHELLREPHFVVGLYVDRQTTGIVPQFYSLLPVYLAIGYWLGGLDGALAVPLVLGVLSLLVFTILAVRIVGNAGAVVAVGLLAVSLPQVWAMRTPLSECGAQLGYAGLLWGLVDAARGTRRMWIVAVLAAGVGCLIRVDFLKLVPPLVLALAAFVPITRRRSLLAFLLALGLLVAWSVWHCHEFSPPYLRHVRGMLRPLLFAVVASFGGAVIVLLARRGRPPPSWTSRLRQVVWLLSVIAIVVGVMYALLVRPETSSDPVDHAESLIRIGWYVSGAGLLLALVGTASLLHRALVRGELGCLLLMATWLPVLAFYLYDPRIYPDHPWATRRMVPVILPGLFLTMGAAAAWLVEMSRASRVSRAVVKRFGRSGRALRLVPAALAVVALAVVGHREITMMRPYLTLTEAVGFREGLARVDAMLPPEAIVLFASLSEDAGVGAPLFFLHGRNALPVAPESHHGPSPALSSQLSAWLADGRPLYFVSRQPPARVRGIRWQKEGQVRFRHRHIGAHPNRPPGEGIAYVERVINVYRASAS